MAPCTCQVAQACKTRDLTHTLIGSNNTVFGDATHTGVVDHVGDEGQTHASTTHLQTNAIGKSDTTISDLDCMLIT